MVVSVSFYSFILSFTRTVSASSEHEKKTLHGNQCQTPCRENRNASILSSIARPRHRLGSLRWRRRFSCRCVDDCGCWSRWAAGTSVRDATAKGREQSCSLFTRHMEAPLILSAYPHIISNKIGRIKRMKRPTRDAGIEEETEKPFN